MIMRRTNSAFVAILFVLLSSVSLCAQTIRIGLYANSERTTALFVPELGNYELYDSGKKIADLDSGKLVTLSILSGELTVKAKGRALEVNGVLELYPTEPVSRFRIRVGEDERLYEDALEVKVHGGKMYLINQTQLETYVMGVVESEVGHFDEVEFLKSQAVIARTYAVKNMNRHKDVGYDLNDGTDAQVFRSIAYSKNAYKIQKAVYYTKGVVVVDNRKQPILTAFHSNSGGQTAASEDVWSSALPYLTSVVDSFSVGMDHYRWETEVSKADWLNFFEMNSGQLSNQDREKLLNYQPVRREPIFYTAGGELRAIEVRRHFKLKSAFFYTETKGNTVYLKGFGFGHGVGLSQEGAVNMARKGYTYRDILSFYYSGTELAELSDLAF